MKDKFFELVFKLYKIIYRLVTKATYIIITYRRCKNKPSLTKGEKKSICDFWKKYYGKKIPTYEYRWYKEKMGYADPRIIPDVIWHAVIEPAFVNLELEKGFQDKNYFDLILGSNMPEVILRCVNGELLDRNYMPLTPERACSTLKSYEEVICKPSIESGGGRGIFFMKNGQVSLDKLAQLKLNYNNDFIIQKIVKQSLFMAQFNPNSLNTMRILTFLNDGKVLILSSFLRIGCSDSRLDNVSSGGAFVQIKENGTFGECAYKENLDSHDLYKAYTTLNGKSLSCYMIPNWGDIVQMVTLKHYRLAHFKIINWDIALDEKNAPVIIEYNLIDSSVYFHQVNAGPVFGENTEYILKMVKGLK